MISSPAARRDLFDLWDGDGLDAFLDRIRNSYSPGRLDILDIEDPSAMDTLGSLIDKLITVNMKMWHNQEVLYEIRRMTNAEFEKRYAESLDELHATVKRCCDLNVQRAKLMDAIDKHVAKLQSGEKKAEVFEQHKTY